MCSTGIEKKFDLGIRILHAGSGDFIFFQGAVALHSAARALSSPSRRQILTMICLVVFCAEMLEKFSAVSKGY